MEKIRLLLVLGFVLLGMILPTGAQTAQSENVPKAEAEMLLLGMILPTGAQTAQSENVPKAEAEMLLDPNALPGTIIATRDFNHDGIDDLAIAESTGVSLWLGDAQGQFRKDTSGKLLSAGGCGSGCRICEFCTPGYCVCWEGKKGPVCETCQCYEWCS